MGRSRGLSDLSAYAHVRMCVHQCERTRVRWNVVQQGGDGGEGYKYTPVFLGSSSKLFSEVPESWFVSEH